MADYFDYGFDPSTSSYVPFDGIFKLGYLQFSDPEDRGKPVWFIDRIIDIPEDFYELVKNRGMLRVCIGVGQYDPDKHNGKSGKLMKIEFHVAKNDEEIANQPDLSHLVKR